MPCASSMLAGPRRDEQGGPVHGPSAGGFSPAESCPSAWDRTLRHAIRLHGEPDCPLEVDLFTFEELPGINLLTLLIHGTSQVPAPWVIPVIHQLVVLGHVCTPAADEPHGHDHLLPGMGSRLRQQECPKGLALPRTSEPVSRVAQAPRVVVEERDSIGADAGVRLERSRQVVEPRLHGRQDVLRARATAAAMAL